MKRIISVLATLAICSAMQAQNHKQEPFYTKDQAPHMEYILPAPPDLSSPRFSDDWNQYLWGKSIRETPRGEQAVADAHIGAEYFMQRFSEVMGHPISPKDNPKLFILLDRAHRTEQIAGASAKAYFHRVRPYQQFHEATSVPAAERATDFTSYPSGHTHASWLTGMILTAIDPQHTEGIMKVAYEMGQSRVIVGFHYQSDVDAGRVAGSITFARLCAMPEFLQMLQECKQEYNANK